MIFSLESFSHLSDPSRGPSLCFHCIFLPVNALATLYFKIFIMKSQSQKNSSILQWTLMYSQQLITFHHICFLSQYVCVCVCVCECRWWISLECHSFPSLNISILDTIQDPLEWTCSSEEPSLFPQVGFTGLSSVIPTVHFHGSAANPQWPRLIGICLCSWTVSFLRAGTMLFFSASPASPQTIG